MLHVDPIIPVSETRNWKYIAYVAQKPILLVYCTRMNFR